MIEGELKKQLDNMKITFYSNVAMIKRHQKRDKRRGKGATIYRVIDLEDFSTIRRKQNKILDEAKADFPKYPASLSEKEFTQKKWDALLDKYDSEVNKWFEKWFGGKDE